MPRPETVEIVASDDFVPDTRIINKEDYDPATHTLASEESEGAAAPDEGIEWEIADNGWWEIRAGEETISGRGESSLHETLDEIGVDR